MAERTGQESVRATLKTDVAYEGKLSFRPKSVGERKTSQGEREPGGSQYKRDSIVVIVTVRICCMNKTNVHLVFLI